MTLSVLHLVNHCERGGNVHLAVDLACEQARRGHRVVFASAGGRFAPLLERSGVRLARLEQSLRSPVRAARAAVALVSLCRRDRPDVLHAHMMSGAVLGRLAATALGIPLVTTVHNSFDRHAWLMRLGDRVVAVSRSERQLLLARGFPPERLDVVVNGTLGSARAAQEAGPPPIRLPRPSITTLSGLERRKGVHDVIEAFGQAAASAPGWQLIVGGDGPERQALERQAARSSCSDRIAFIGHVETPRQVLDQSDIFVLASAAEPFGLGILEAREAGCAVIGTRVGGIAEQLDRDRFGTTVPPGRPDLLGGALRRLMTDPVALADGRRRAQQGLAYYRVDRMAGDYLAVYEAAIRSRRGPARAAGASLGTSSATGK
ncbi:MAG TPA: glycosyltransferase family 4 protein [Amaricoccus sp.]|uniref:glycosyltransferase family 4 protein n=1 Tax=Amaricoccus sp. TaxID=1872485 RepID=UPI002C2CF2BF|nr:glycosyltransferase family 4 protein [Amaricoccus sp.]HMQ92239.1 glycosyltransferase family 4 protein [Amaricoccus sp.]HMR51644.1 glycosyltransferase family 4 protein [Amaricoccus sp.]HMR59076.1 glycosyltransferase family 4 protein [Amaricoccus sp.]HMT98420.1 glycosyltransferase family 4 protein [Amaricoccus sp.]